MIRNLNILVVYDITDNKRRRNLRKFLKGFGVRTQYSFFECLVSDVQLEKLKDGIKNLVDPDEDKVGVVLLCDRCFKRIFRLGFDSPELFDGTSIML